MAQPRLKSRPHVALTLLLPLYMHTTTLYEFGFVLIMTFVIASSAVYFGHRTFDVDVAKHVAVELVCSFLANHVANFLVVGSWMQILLAYFICWETQFYLPLEMAKKHRDYEEQLRKSRNWSPLLSLASILTGFWTIFLGRYGFLNTGNPPYGAFLRGVVIWLVTVDLLLHSIVAVTRGLEMPMKRTSSVRDIDITKSTAEGETVKSSNGPDDLDDKLASAQSSKLNCISSKVPGETTDTSKARALFSEEAKEKFWTDGTLEKINHDEIVELKAVAVPKVQKRPSSRKKG